MLWKPAELPQKQNPSNDTFDHDTPPLKRFYKVFRGFVKWANLHKATWSTGQWARVKPTKNHEIYKRQVLVLTH